MAAGITAAGGKAVALQADVRDAAQVAGLVAAAEKDLGPIDILVLNAGPAVPWKAVTELTQAEFEAKVLDEMRSFFLPAKAVMPGLIARKGGCIIGISSGLSRYPSFGFTRPHHQQVGGRRADEIAGLRAGAPRHPGQHRGAGPDPHRRHRPHAARNRCRPSPA